jgi:hypothetical protein
LQLGAEALERHPVTAQHRIAIEVGDRVIRDDA